MSEPGSDVLPPVGNTGVGFKTPGRVAAAAEAGFGVHGWDWSATTHPLVDNSPAYLVDALRPWVVRRGKGLQGWSQSLEAFDRDGYALGSVFFGGGREDAHVLATGGAAHNARRAVAVLAEARTSRVDTRVDTLAPFEDLAAILEAGAAVYGSQIIRTESSVRGVSTGRTVYLGAPASAVRVRLYEKWLQAPGDYLEGTNRVEVQLRPHSRAKAMVSGWSPAETFCATRTTRDLAAQLGVDVAAPPALEVSRGTPDLEARLASMGRQYGNTFVEWMDVSGGDVSAVVEHLTGERVPPPARLALVSAP